MPMRFGTGVVAVVAAFLCVVGLGSCGSRGTTTTASLPEEVADPGAPGERDDPVTCMAREAEERRAELSGGGPPVQHRDIPVDTVPAADERVAIDIVRRDAQVAAALDAPGTRLAWATTWYVEDEDPRGVTLFYEFARPVALPSSLGVPADDPARDEGGTLYGDDGLRVLVRPGTTADFTRALSAQLSVDLSTRRLHHNLPSPEHLFC